MKLKHTILFLVSCFAISFTRGETLSISDLQLSQIEFKNSVLEGELTNRGKETATEVWIHVVFQDESGKGVLEQDFRIIPGGDGNSIPPNWSKHFRYHLKLNTSSKLAPIGTIKSVNSKFSFSGKNKTTEPYMFDEKRLEEL